MKPIIVALLLLASVAQGFSQACCCTGAGANYSILPNLDKHVIGLRYSFSHYSTTTYATYHHMMGGKDMLMTGNGQAGTENMNTLDLFGRFNLYKGLQLSVFVPVHFLEERTNGQIKHTSGLGDMSLLLQYSLLDPKKCSGKKSKHQLRVGAGIKLPSGQFSMNKDGMFSTDLQLGTGSVDFLFNTIYTYRYKKFGFNIPVSYKRNTINPQQFRFGDKLMGGASVFYVLSPVMDVVLMPSVGLNYSYIFYNEQKKEKLTNTGGQYLNASAGLDISYKHLAFSAAVSPVLMSISNWEGQPIPHVTFETGLYYNF